MKKNVLNIIFSSIVLQIIVLLSGFIIPKLIIENYGSSVNGLVTSIKQLFAYFSVISVAISSAVGVSLYGPLVKKDYKVINNILTSTAIFFNKIGIFLFIVTLTISILFPYIIKSQNTFFFTSSIIMVLGISAMMEYALVSKYRVLLMADQKNNIISLISAKGIILNTVVTLILIYINAPILIVIIASSLAYLFRLLETKKKVELLYPLVNFNLKSNNKFIIDNKLDAFLYYIPGVVISYTPIVLVVLSNGLENASVFSIYNMIFLSLAMIVTIFSSGIPSIFGNMIATMKIVDLKKNYRIYSLIMRIITFSLYTTAIFLTIPFIKLYINNSDGVNYINFSLAIGFALNGLFKNIRVPSSVFIEAAGDYKRNKNKNIIEAIILIILSIILLNYFGILGILISGVISSFWRSVMYIVDVEKNILKESPKNEILKYVLNVTMMTLLIILLKEVPTLSMSLNYFYWIVNAMWMFIGVLLSYALLNIFIDMKYFKYIIKSKVAK